MFKGQDHGRYDATPMTDSISRPGADVAATRWLAVSSLMGLIVLSLAWELWLAPMRPGGSWLVLKALPPAAPPPSPAPRPPSTHPPVRPLVRNHLSQAGGPALSHP